MAKERLLQLEKYGISRNRYLELKYFCKQYHEKIRKLNSITEIGAVSVGSSMGGGALDKIADTAIKWIQLEREIHLIEQAAIETGGEIYQYILENVTKGIPYEYLDVPYSKSSFYEKRRKFFLVLDNKKQI